MVVGDEMKMIEGLKLMDGSDNVMGEGFNFGIVGEESLKNRIRKGHFDAFISNRLCNFLSCKIDDALIHKMRRFLLDEFCKIYPEYSYRICRIINDFKFEQSAENPSKILWSI